MEALALHMLRWHGVSDGGMPELVSLDRHRRWHELGPAHPHDLDDFSTKPIGETMPDKEHNIMYWGCMHPAWPDPLSLGNLEHAAAWYEQHKAKHPGIYVLRQVIDQEIVLGPSK